MKPTPLKVTTFADILEQSKRNAKVWFTMLTPEEQAECAAFNTAMLGKSIPEILEMGPNPFKAYYKKYTGEELD